jgi:HPr kinase/phosphorylase
MQRDIITVERFFTSEASQLGLKLIGGASGLKRIIREPTVNRPGLALSGFTRYFAGKRIQVMGNAETGYLKSLDAATREERYREFFGHQMPCVVFGRDLKPDKQFLRAAEKADVPVFQTPLITMKFINLATLSLERLFAPRGTELGSMIDILGVGVIVKGESGIGKSECVLALIERGYSLVSDDVTRVWLEDERDVIGTSAELTRGHMEVRGIGIINVAAMFGVKSVRRDKRVDLIVSLKAWDDVPDIDRLGIEEQHLKVLGVEIPHITIPVRPGRDIARLVEVAALQTKLKSGGYNPAQELNERLLAKMAGDKGL